MLRARAVRWSDPYRMERLPLLSRLHRAAYRASPSTKRKLLQYPLFKLFPLAYRLGLAGRGAFRLRVGEGEKVLPFDARNLQFSSLYMPQHAGGYESETFALLDALLADDGVLYDVGSNWGYYSLALAARAGFRGRAHAFEPSTRVAAELGALAGAAGLAERVSGHAFALSDADGSARLLLPDGLHGGSATLAPSGGEPIERRRLDGLDFEAPSVVKIDAEGHEAQVIAGGARALAAAAPFIVFESWLRPEEPASVLRPFEALRALGAHSFYEPAWARESAGGWVPARDVPPPERARLALVPFEPEQRFGLHEQLNVLACPASRLSQLEALFPETKSF